MMRYRPLRPIRRRLRTTLLLATGLLGVVAAALIAAPANAAGVHWASIAGNGSSTCAIRSDHTLWCMGNNAAGQVGIGPSAEDDWWIDDFTEVGGLWSMVSPGRNHWCGIREEDGRRYCWGSNAQGQLGLGDTVTRFRPTALDGEDITWRTVDGGDGYTCGIVGNGTLRCWGSNFYGQLGVGDLEQRLVPARVTRHTWKAVSAGFTSTCALYTNGTRYCWGSNAQGVLGLGDTTQRSRPYTISNEGKWLTVDVGEISACGIRADHTLACWGSNASGRLGLGDTTERRRPTTVEGSDWTAVSVGRRTCGIRGGGQVYCWGPDSEKPIQLDPYPAYKMSPLSSIQIMGGYQACGVRLDGEFGMEDGAAWCWKPRTPPERIPVS